MHQAAKIKPVVIDEALVDFEHLQLAMELGYSGIALKTCKGQSQALLMGAAALKYNLFPLCSGFNFSECLFFTFCGSLCSCSKGSGD